MPRKNVRRAASKEALKQMQLLSATAYEDDDNDVETFEIASDDDIDDDDVDDDESMEVPPKKKYRLSHRKSSDGNDRDVLVLKSVEPIEEPLKLEVWPEDLSEAQLAVQQKVTQEIEELNVKIDQLKNSMAADVVYQTDNCSAIEFSSASVPPLTYTSPKKDATPNKSYQKISLQTTTNKGNNSKGSYKLVMDPRIGVIVGTMTPATNSALATSLITKGQTSLATAQSPPVIQTRQAKKRGRHSISSLSSSQQLKQQKQLKHQTLTKPQSSLPISAAVIQLRPTESTAVGGLNTDPTLPLPATTKPKTNNTTTTTIDLTADDGQSGSDTREVSFNKIQGRTYPSLIVVARPHLCVKDNVSEDRNKLDAKVKSVLLHAPTKFTEWLIQQGLVRSEQSCVNHPNTKLKLGMYSDVTRFPYSGGYVWISECCPTRFVSVFSGSLFEGSPHPPSVMLKLIYHWACQTNVQNILQWVKVDNSYIKGINTWLRTICTVALHTHIKLLGGLGKRVEVGIISLGTTSQDGQQRQVKVEILGIIETDLKRIRLRAVEPVVDSDRNRRKRFIKILEPLLQWVHSDSTIVTDATVDKSTLFSMGFKHVIQASSSDNTGNRTVMEYLRRIVPRMFQNTLSLFSRQIIQQFLDELVWREWYGCTASLCFDNIIAHLSEQTRTDVGQSLIAHLNKVAANPFKNWSILPTNQQVSIVNKPKVNEVLPSAKPYSSPAVLNVSTKRTSNRQRKVLIRNLSPPLSELQSSRPPRTISPDVPEQLVPLENYYYGTVEGNNDSVKVNVEFTIKCSLCKGHFNNNIKLMNHLFSHAHSITGGIQQCRYCLSSVGSHDGLIKHIATSHPIETRFQDGYVCIICESRFPNSFGLGKHLSREHVPAELPYQCGTCNYRCSSHRQAIDHFYNLHDSGVTIQCPFCLKSTSIWSGGRVLPQNINYFMQHLQKHQKKAMAKKCPKCALWFIHKDTLKDHQVNMHLTQRRKGGLVAWLPPTNGLMVPKSRQDKQVWEDGDREIDLNSLTINASNQLACKECKSGINSPKHFQSLESCLNRNCRYITCCKNAMEHHKTICKDLETSLPIHILPKQMHCVCGYSDDDGNILAKHLAECERKSAYPTAEAAKNAIKPNNMLDVLGLVRRLEEPLTPSAQEAKDPPVIAVIELDDDEEDGDAQKAREAEKIDEEVQKIKEEQKTEEAKEQKVKEKEQKTEEEQTTEEERNAKEEEEQKSEEEQKAEKEEQKAEVEQMAEEDQKTDEDEHGINEEQQTAHKEEQKTDEEKKVEEEQKAEEDQKTDEEEQKTEEEQKAEEEEQKAHKEKQKTEEEQKAHKEKQKTEEEQKAHKEKQKTEEEQKAHKEKQKTEEQKAHKEKQKTEEEQKAHKEEQKTEEEQKAEVEQMVEEDQKTVEKEEKMTKEEEQKVEGKEEEEQETEKEEEVEQETEKEEERETEAEKQLKSDDIVQHKTEQTVDNNKIEDKQEKEEEERATKLKDLVLIEHELEENGVTFALDDSPKVDDDKHNKIIISDDEETPSGELDDREVGEPDDAMEVEEIMSLENNDKVIAGEEKMETDEDLTVVN